MKNKPEPWIPYSIAAAAFWGTWGVVAKLISANVSPFTNLLLFSVGGPERNDQLYFRRMVVRQLLGRDRRTDGPAGREIECPGGQVDGPRLGILAQNGTTAFRYQFALTTHPAAFDALAALRFSLEHQNPLVTGAVTGSADVYPGGAHSLLGISDKNALLWSLKLREEGIGQGLIARFWNVKTSTSTPAIRLPYPIRRAWQTSHLETNERDLTPANGTLVGSFAPGQLNTYRLQR